MKITILTLFPDMFTGIFQQSILKQAQEKELVEYNVVNFRDYSTDRHQRVDDYPYGGGAGMVLTPQPLFDAVDAVKSSSASTPRVVLLCPQGETYNQQKAEEFAKEEELILICGHYEGYDERIRQELVTDEISIGGYILTGGEIGAMAVVDSVTRLLPGVLGNEESAIKDSFSSGLLEHPHYTRPAKFLSYEVPEVLLSGHHANINKWRRRESLRRTFERRPDLLEKIQLSDSDKEFLLQLENKLEK